MGLKLLDQYSYLHFAVGIIAYFWGITFTTFLIMHVLFEFIENTKFGMKIINTYFDKIWPGGKSISDSIINITGDNLCALLGWISAYYLDKIGNQRGWYKIHIKI
jgi:hypothetical protein